MSEGKICAKKNSDRKLFGTKSVRSVIKCIQLQQHYRTLRYIRWEYGRADSTSVVVKRLRIIKFSVQMKLKIINISEIQGKGNDTLARP